MRRLVKMSWAVTTVLGSSARSFDDVFVPRHYFVSTSGGSLIFLLSGESNIDRSLEDFLCIFLLRHFSQMCR